MSDDGSEGLPGVLENDATRPDTLSLPVGVGRRVLVAANLRLGPEATAESTWAAGNLARALETWSGPGLVVLAGNLVEVGEEQGPDAARLARRALDAHPRLADALRAFAAEDERRVLHLPGTLDGALCGQLGADALGGCGLEQATRLDLRLETASGTRVVQVDPAPPPPAPLLSADPAAPGDAGAGGLEGVRARDAHPAGSTGSARLAASAVATGFLTPDPDAAWQHGLDQLTDPGSGHRFLTSRLLYRRFARFVWWLLLPFAVAVALRLPYSSTFLEHLVRGHVGARVREAAWGPRLAVAGVVSAFELLVLVAVLAWLSRQAWRTLGGGRLDAVFGDPLPTGATANDPGRDRARALAAEGYAGMISGATLQAELTDLRGAFFASPGAVGEVVEEHPGRLGLPPVFLEHRQASWVELETGAELHARLLLARNDSGPATILERLAARSRQRRRHDSFPVVVAAHPHGASWPPAPDLGTLRRRSRRVRRWGAAAIALAGVTDLLSALTPPLRSRLHVVLQVLPLAATQAAGAIVALSGIGLLALARGIRRGQHRAWAIATGLLSLTLVLHVIRGGDLEESALCAAVLLVLLVFRSEFTAPSDRPSLRSAGVMLVAGSIGITVVTTIVVEITLRVSRFPHHFISVWRAAYAVIERLVGVQTVRLNDRLDDFLHPSLLAVGVLLALTSVLLATRPVVDRRLSAGRAAEIRARDVVRRHGHGTLDYFALRSDKRWYFHRDSLVAYAIYGGICLVSPDPVGPLAEREQVWNAFRRFAEARGWVVAVMGASEEWLPLYRSSGMHDIYIGDEAVVDVRRFSLSGGHMKGLRQAHNRIAKYGYTVSFHDPSRLGRDMADRLIPLMSQSRRGEFERGFSMMLGRVFDPRDHGLVLCVVTGPDGEPAAMCQFVPASGIQGYSLDLMRRDKGEHPNGLVDFALVSSIEHFRELGCHGLSLNFAAMRSILEGERGDGVTQRVERWALQKMSSFLQIETLWRFNAKYGPDWLPRYVVYDAAEHLVPAVLAILRAESLSEVPVIGRVLVASQRRAARAKGGEGSTSGASLLPTPAVDSEVDTDTDVDTDVDTDGARSAASPSPAVEEEPGTGPEARPEARPGERRDPPRHGAAAG